MTDDKLSFIKNQSVTESVNQLCVFSSFYFLKWLFSFLFAPCFVFHVSFQFVYPILWSKSPYSVRIRENTHQKKPHIWPFFTQWDYDMIKKIVAKLILTVARIMMILIITNMRIIKHQRFQKKENNLKGFIICRKFAPYNLEATVKVNLLW